MENYEIEENMVSQMDLNDKNSSNFYSEYNPEEKSSFPEISMKKTNIIMLDDKINSIDKIDQNFQYENYSDIEIEHKDISFDDFSSIQIENKEEDFGMNSSIQYLKEKINLFSGIEKFNYLILAFNKKNSQVLKNSIIKCLLYQKNNNDNEDCDCIPLITKKKYYICFYCHNHENEKYMEMNFKNILENMDKLFIQGSRNSIKKNKDNKENNNYMNLINENITKFKLDLGYLKIMIILLLKKFGAKLKEKIKDFKSYVIDFNNKKEYDETFRIQALKRIKQTYLFFISKFNLMFYFIIIKRLMCEFKNSEYLGIKKRIILLKNLKYAWNIIEEYKNENFYLKKFRKSKQIEKIDKAKENIYPKFNWIIHFYLEEEIKSDDERNIFIATNLKGIISIFSIFFFKNQKTMSNKEKENTYEIIKTEKIDCSNLIKITKLKKLFKTKACDNYFIINSMNSPEFGQAVIINIIEKFDINSDIKEKYEIKIIQIIKEVNGLLTSIEFNYRENTYLINFYRNFYLWKYNSETNQIEKYNKENQINDDNKTYNYGTLIYEASKKLFIIQCFLPKSIIEFYNLIEENDNFSFNKIDKIIEFKEGEDVLKNNINYFIYKNKYLLLCSGKNKNNLSSGIYLIDLEKFELLYIQRFPKYISINCIIPSNNNNMFIASSIFNSYVPKTRANDENKIKEKQIARGRLILVEIKEDNNKILLNIKKYIEGGPFYYINCQELFFDEYLFTSIYKNNSLIKLNKQGKFSQYFEINN